MVRLSRCLSLVIVSVWWAGCDDRGGGTKKVAEPFSVVPGSPQVESGGSEVLRDPARHTDDFRVRVPRQCDLYQQVSLRKVDILWVVDSSGSMAPKQKRLADNFQGFIDQLVNADPPIDFHIAVTTTDTDNPAKRGALQSWSQGGASANFIACVPKTTGSGSSCNTKPGDKASAVDAFKQMVNVGTNGSPAERGLYATYLALTNPANRAKSETDGFLRTDAALYVVVVSDEDDTSCTPLVAESPGFLCTADPGCHCAPDGFLSSGANFGSTEYFARFLETFKGYGNGELVALAAIVSLDSKTRVPSQFGDPSAHVGCCSAAGGGACPTSGTNPGTYEISYYGGRYIKVAEETGGVAVNICQDNFQSALANLGYAASGLRKEFKLTRGPEGTTNSERASKIDLYISDRDAPNCQIDTNCPDSTQTCRSGRCARRKTVSVAASETGAQYVKCDAQAFRNVIRFGDRAIPSSLSAVEICYDVAADFSTSCP